MRAKRTTPKTSAIPATGTCGHDFSHRCPVPAHLIGQPLEGDFLSDFQAWKSRMAVVLGSSECNDCQAARNLSNTRLTLTAWAQWLQVSEPCPLEASSVRMMAFGEGVRSDLLRERLAAVASTTFRAFAEDDLSHRLFWELLKARWPNERWIDPKDPRTGSPAGHRLLQSLPRGMESPSRIYLGHRETPQQALALWLVSRSVWPDNKHVLFGERSARQWVIYKSRRRSDLRDMARGDVLWNLSADVLAARLVAGLEHWEEPSDAWEAFSALRSSRVADLIGGAIAEDSSLSLMAFVRAGASMAAISGG